MGRHRPEAGRRPASGLLGGLDPATSDDVFRRGRVFDLFAGPWATKIGIGIGIGIGPLGATGGLPPVLKLWVRSLIRCLDHQEPLAVDVLRRSRLGSTFELTGTLRRAEFGLSF